MSEPKTALDLADLRNQFASVHIGVCTHSTSLDASRYADKVAEYSTRLAAIPADAVERIKRLENARSVIEGTMSVCETCNSKCVPTCFSYATKMERERNDALGTIVQLEKRAEQADKNVMWVTGLLDEHPEGYDGPCDCGLCRSYGAEDSGLDEEE